MIYPEPEKGGRGRTRAVKEAKKLGGFSDDRLRQSRAILRAALDDLAPQMLSGVPLANGVGIRNAYMIVYAVDYHRHVTRVGMTEAIVEDKAGHCWRCREPYVAGELITPVYGCFLFRSPINGRVHRYREQWGTMCPHRTTEAELARAPRRVNCHSCGQPLATPPSIRQKMGFPFGPLVCSDRCAQRWRRRRQVERRRLPVCDGCGGAFQPSRGDARFCTKACGQSAYRRRVAT